VFGAGKTRAAAAIIAGLITIDPSLQIMVLTKENVASQAFAEHIIGLSLPTWIESWEAGWHCKSAGQGRRMPVQHLPAARQNLLTMVEHAST